MLCTCSLYIIKIGRLSFHHKQHVISVCTKTIGSALEAILFCMEVTGLGVAAVEMNKEELNVFLMKELWLI